MDTPAPALDGNNKATLPVVVALPIALIKIRVQEGVDGLHALIQTPQDMVHLTGALVKGDRVGMRKETMALLQDGSQILQVGDILPQVALAEATLDSIHAGMEAKSVRVGLVFGMNELPGVSEYDVTATILGASGGNAEKAGAMMKRVHAAVEAMVNPPSNIQHADGANPVAPSSEMAATKTPSILR